MQIKTTLKSLLTPIRMTVINNINNNVGKNVGKKEPLYTVNGNANSYNHYGNQYGGYSKKKYICNHHMIQQHHSWA
jgi:hypothetical protein